MPALTMPNFLALKFCQTNLACCKIFQLQIFGICLVYLPWGFWELGVGLGEITQVIRSRIYLHWISSQILHQDQPLEDLIRTMDRALSEIMTLNRPTYQIDAQNPGSDLAGESAAAIASASSSFYIG